MAKIKITSVNDKLLDKYIRHSVWMEQLKAGEAAAISKMLKKEVFPQLYDKLIKELERVPNLKTAGSIRKIKRIKQMMASVEQTATAGAIKAGKLINQKMYNVAKFEAKWNQTILEKTVPLDISMEVPSNAVLKQLVLSSTFEGHRMQTWMKGYSRSVQAGIVKQLKAGVATGESLPKIAKRLRKVLGQKSRQAESLARTAVSNIVHDAREATFVANKKLIRKVQWVATLDHRTTLICINLDGKVFNVGEGPRPPVHFNCRSTSVPVVTSWNEYGVTAPPAFTRASMDGAVPAKTNYRQWLKRQSKSTQIKVLGKKRQALYVSGKVKIDRFVGKDFKPLTLKQLERREGLAPKRIKAKVTKGLQPAPQSVRIIDAKGSGQKLTAIEEDAIGSYKMHASDATRQIQLGQELTDDLVSRSEGLEIIRNMDTGLAKMKGYNGTTYRGLNFVDDGLKDSYMKQFKKGGIWKSKSFQSTSKDLDVAESFAIGTKKGNRSVLMKIKGKSGRDISEIGFEGTEFAELESEVLFRAGTPFRVTKIKGNEIWLEEITEVPKVKVVKKTPFTVKVQPLKNNGIDLTPAEIKMLDDYSWETNSHNVVRAQLGQPSRYARKDWNFASKKEALLQADKIETALKKMDGYDGTTYRGLRFSTSKQRQTFLDQFKEGTVWDTKSFQSTSKSKSVAEGFMKEEAKFYASKNSVMMHIKGKSGRDLNNRMQEVLYMKNTPLRVTKIKGNEIWLEELTDVSEKLTTAAKAEATVTTTSKVGITISHDTSLGFQKLVRDQIDTYPESVKASLNKRGVSFQAGRRVTDMRPDLKGQHPRGWPAGTTWDSVDGFYNKSTKTITVSETHRPIKSKTFVKVSANSTKGVLNHEAGHGFDWTAEGVIHSQQKVFKDAWKKDIAAMGGKKAARKKGLNYFVQSDGAGESETFAEVFAVLMGRGAAPGMNLAIQFPNCKRYIESLL